MRTVLILGLAGAALVLSLMAPATPARAEAELPSLTKKQLEYVNKHAPAARAKLRGKLTAFLAANQDDTGTREIFARWYPELADLVGTAGAVENPAPGKAGRKLIKSTAKAWASLAIKAQNAGMGATSGWEAFRSWSFDPAPKSNGRMLGYTKVGRVQGHPRGARLEERGLTLTQYGWLDKRLAKKGRKGKVPERNGWMVAEEADKKHQGWAKARILKFTLHNLQTDLPIAKAIEVGARIEFALHWMRAHYVNVEGYREPSFPLNIWVVAKDSEYQAIFSARGEALESPLGQYNFRRSIAYVNAQKSELSFMKTVGVAQHEACHALFHGCFPGSQARGVAKSYGWVMEAVPGAAYYVSPMRPVDGDFVRRTRERLTLKEPEKKEGEEKKDGEKKDDGEEEEESGPRIDDALKKVLDGKDILGRLNGLKYDAGRADRQAHVAGSLFVVMCWQDDTLREAAASFVATGLAWKAEKDDFEKAFGPSPAFGTRLGEWLASRK